MPDLDFLIIPALVLAAALVSWSYTRDFYRKRLNEVSADRNRLLAALTHLRHAVNDPHLDLPRAVAHAEKVIDGRWTT